MEITRIEKVNKSKLNIYIDGEYAFFLYQKDINQYHLKEGMELNPELYEEIREEIVLYRAKQKALSLLKFMDRTKQQLKRKLKEAGYSEDIVESAIAYIDSFGYLSDERYASVYIRERKHRKSKLALKVELSQKGVPNEIIEQVFEREYQEEAEDDPEMIAIKKSIAKKKLNLGSLSWEEKQKIIASLYRKGFELDKINKVLASMEEPYL